MFGTITPGERAGTFAISLASGGHPPALLLRADGTADYLPTVGGQLIGMLTHPHVVTLEVQLHPGDTLLLYTDGVTEARVVDTDHDRYGEDEFLAFTRTVAPATATDTVAAVVNLLDTLGTGVQDDTAVMAIHAPRHDHST